MSWAPAKAPVSNGNLSIFLFISVACKYNVLFFSDLERFILSLGSVHPATEESSDQFLYDDVNASSECGVITTLQLSAISVTCTCGGGSRTISRALAADNESVASTTGRRPFWKPYLSSCSYSSRRIKRLLNTTRLRFSSNKYHRYRIIS